MPMLEHSLSRFGSGLPFPIPRENSILVKYRNSRGISGRLPHEIPLSKATDLVSPEIVDLDFPFTKLSDFHLYGPIALNSVPIQDLDPQLSNRFDAAPTVLMSIGTRFVHTQAQVRAILRGFLTALDLEMRVLWKLPHHSLFKDIIGELLPGAEDKEQFMIVDWIPVDPFSIMTQECP